MKKLYFFLLLLFSLVGVTQVQAQDFPDEVELEVLLSNGKWIAWNGNEATPWARSWYSTTTPAISICTKNGGMETVDIRGNKFNGANNMSTWGDDKDNIMFYSRYGSADAIYEVMVEKGWYIKAVMFDFNCSNDKGAKDGSITVRLEDADEATSEDINDDQHVEWENDDESVFSAKFTVVRNDGTYNFARTSNFTVIVGYLGPKVSAADEVEAIYEQYKPYLEDDAIAVGTLPGQYDSDAYDAFKEIMNDWDETYLMEDYMSMEVDEIKAVGESIKAAFEALLATRVPIDLVSGYYRIRSAHEFTLTEIDEETETEVTTHPLKYLSAKMGAIISAIYSTPNDLATFAPAIWKVENKDSVYDVMNAEYEVRFNAGKPVTLSAESDSLIALDPVNTENGITRVNIRLAATKANAYNYFHCAGWSNSQTNSITLWSNNDPASASEWVFEPVSDEDVQAAIAAYAEDKAHELMLVAYDTLVTASKRELGNVLKQINVDDSQNLITSADQFSSPYSDADEGTDFGALLDGKNTTYWHSDWHNGNQANHTHYLQVALNEVVTTDISMTFTRRPVTNDHITLWSVYGSNNYVDEEQEGDWEFLLYIMTPYTSNTETLTSLPFGTKGYKNLRFYIDGTTTGRGYGHMSEFQLNPASLKEANYLAEAIALNNIICEQSLMAHDSIQQAEFDALLAAYDALKAKFVNAEALRQALADTKGGAQLIVKGTNPGQWADDSQAAAFQALYDEAETYYAAGVFEEAKINDYANRLNAMKDDILKSANGVKTNKWYKISFASEEDFDAHEWDKVAGNADVIKAIEGDITQSQALWSKYIAAADLKVDSTEYTIKVTEDSTAARKSAIYTVIEAEAEDMTIGSRLYFIDKDELTNQDMMLFRFVAVGDSAYALQNKATGLFVKAGGSTGAVSLSAHPTLFTTSALGYGFNLIAAKTLTAGASQNYLHAQVSGNMLVTWNATTLGSRSALYIEEVGDAADFVAEINLPISYGGLNNFCFPVKLKANEGQAWTVTAVENNNVSLAKVGNNEIHAGRPFIFINGKLVDYNEEEKPENIKFTMFVDEFAKAAQNQDLLKGTYESIVIDKGEIYFEGNKFVVNATDKDAIMVALTRIEANKAYISTETPQDPKADVTVVWDENAEDGIQTALANVSKAGAVYTIDGRMVSKHATLNEISNFGKGIYILNGTKVIVK